VLASKSAFGVKRRALEITVLRPCYAIGFACPSDL
jgi:hypothetical protein